VGCELLYVFKIVFCLCVIYCSAVIFFSAVNLLCLCIFVFMYIYTFVVVNVFCWIAPCSYRLALCVVSILFGKLIINM